MNGTKFISTPLKEVALLFIGIFATMMPALDWLRTHAATFGALTPTFYYFGSGTLSSVLDNAPTYLTFFNLGSSSVNPELVSEVQATLQNGATALVGSSAHPIEVQSAVAALHQYFSAACATGTINSDQIRTALLISSPGLVKMLVSVSIGSVFFGANTYIGNGPNFMVKAIADHQKVHTPGFIRYVVKFTVPFMIPMLVLVWLVFFRN
jgi:Na+/H+ antiporter NhaD/arsenite permease-like protein